MTRFYDLVGYGIPEEVVEGVWTDSITERAYYGDVLTIMASNQESEQVNDNVRLQQKISIVADAFAYENFSRIKFVLWMDTPWKVQSISVERPRLELTLGGVYSGPRATASAP